MHLLLHILLGVALAPGSLILLAVVAWRAARAATGFSRPPLPLRSASGEVLCTVEDWQRHARAQFPVKYALFESLPRVLRQLGRAVSRPFRIRTVREDILFKAFGVFRGWVEANSDWVYGSVYALDDAGPSQQELATKAEVQSVYWYWRHERPRLVRQIDGLALDDREHYVLSLEQDDQLYFARLANLWRTLT